MTGLTGWRWRLGCVLTLAAALAAVAPTTGDIGLTWDEPAYRYCQQMSAQWWEQLREARTKADLDRLFDRDALLYYWPYGRFGLNFHPPLAGQLSLLTHSIFGPWMKDVPSRRMASVIEYALAITILFGFLSGRYGPWVGAVAAASLLLTPRVYGDGHIGGTDAPGLLLWPATAVSFWKGLHEPNARGWRVLVGVLLGLAFLEKIAAVIVVAPLLLWLIAARLPGTFVRRSGRADWADGLLTTAAMLLPLGLAFREIVRLAHELPPPKYIDIFAYKDRSDLPGAVLAAPLLVWLGRRLLALWKPTSPVWGVERPALEVWTAMLALAPIIAWLGNPAWWRESLTRLAHYYTLSVGRRGSLPEIQILYFGQIYHYSLPWHNAWVLMGITVPAGVLAAAVLGLIYVVRHARRDRLPLFFLLNLSTLPIARMFSTPGHDGVRLFLPSFFFLAALAGWGLVWAADVLARLLRKRPLGFRLVLAAAVLGSAARELVRIHPFELSYYNELVGGPRGAWGRGFELSYWYDAFNPRSLAEINARLPRDARVEFASDTSAPPTFEELQSLGALRGDVRFESRVLDEYPYLWLLTNDAKSTAFTRLLFVLKPWYEYRPDQLGRLRVAAIADPTAAARASALWMLLDAPDESPPDPPAAPAWVRRNAPWLGRFWGEGITKARRLAVNEPLLKWAEQEPRRVLGAARTIAGGDPFPADSDAARLMGFLTRYDGLAQGRPYSKRLLYAQPEALVDAVHIIITYPKELRKVMLRYGYTDPDAIGGRLDRDLTEGPPRGL